MSYQLSLIPHTLRFSFDARTSRGAMQTHQVYYLLLRDTQNPGLVAVGECAPLPGLSPDFAEIEAHLQAVMANFNAAAIQNPEEIQYFVHQIDGGKLPSVKFALETAIADLKADGSKKLFPSDFTDKQAGIPINGLVWMGDKTWMRDHVTEKISKGFTTIKLKIGALDFAEELAILKWMRDEFSEKDLTIRVDANGAFAPKEARQKLEHLSAYQIHSIEQPIKPGQWEEMAHLCQTTPVAIALDEELIGNQETAYKTKLLKEIKPQFIILKPTLHGGLSSCADWIKEAENLGVGWWMTSALESNIGLNAVSQFTALYNPELPQGLGTGQLYQNNIESPLTVKKGNLYYDEIKNWGELP